MYDGLTNVYYVYLLLDPRKKIDKKVTIDNIDKYIEFEPFYVGKGKGNRARVHLANVYKQKKNSFKINKINKIRLIGLEPIILVFENNLIETVALELEKKVVKYFGRIDLGTGCLTNLSDGGDSGIREGWSKLVGVKISRALNSHPEENSKVKQELWKKEEYRKKQQLARCSPLYKKQSSEKSRKIMNANWCNEEFIKKMNEVKKRPRSQKWKDNFSKSFKEKWRTDEDMRNRMNRHKTKNYFISGNGIDITLIGKKGVDEWCKNNGFYLSTVLKYLNKEKSYKGFYIKGGRKC